MHIERRREVDLIEETLELRDALTVELHVVEVLAGPDLLLVPAAVAEDEPVQNAEPIALAVARRRDARGRHELPSRQRVRALPVDEEPAVGRRRAYRPAESGDVPRREPRAAVAVALLEGGCK